MVQLVFIFVNERTDLLQALQIPDGGGKEQAEDQIDCIGEALVALLLIRNKVYHHVGFVVAHRDTDVTNSGQCL